MPPVTGGLHVVSDPIFVNVYWDGTAWDANMAASPLATMASIDAFTRAVVEGSYFDGLAQYGVSRGSFAGSVAVAPGSAATLDEAQILNFAEGLLNAPPPGTPDTDRTRTIYNIFLSTTTTLVAPSLSGSGIVRTPQGTVAGYHSCGAGLAGSCLPYTVIVTGNLGAASCTPFGILGGVAGLGTFRALTRVMTHEMVEAATDPDGATGWRDWTVSNGEIADFGGNPGTCFLAGNTADYWSNAAGGIVTGPGDTTPPAISSVTRTSRTPGLHLEIRGVGFGPPPPDLPTLPATGNTAFLAVSDPATGLIGGHPAGTAPVHVVSWRDDAILLEDSDNALDSRNPLSVQVFGRRNGLESNLFTLPTPVPTSMYLETTPQVVDAGPTPLDVRGRVLDQFGGPFPGGMVQWSFAGPNSADFRTSGQVTTDGDGWFHLPVPLGHSGIFTLEARAGGSPSAPRDARTLMVRPTVLRAEPDHQALGEPRHRVTVRGYGLREVNQVWFGGIQGIINDPADRDPDGTWLRLNPPPAGGLGGNGIGWVDVVAHRLIPSSATPVLESARHRGDLFAFYRAGVPILLPPLDGFECNPALLVAVAWTADGAPDTRPELREQIRFRTNRGSFSRDSQQREYTPDQMHQNEVLASLWEGPGTEPYVASVGMVGRDGERSSRPVNFNDVVCRIVRTTDRVRQAVGVERLRGALKEWVRPPIPRDRFADVVRPLQVEIRSAAAAGKGEFTHQAWVRVRDARGAAVTGLPVVFVATHGRVDAAAPVLTDRRGEARVAVRPSAGTARVVGIVDEHPRAVTAAIGAGAKEAASPAQPLSFFRILLNFVQRLLGEL